MTALPKFSFSSMTLKTDDDLKAAATIGESPFFRPGKHDVVVTKCEYVGPAADPTWAKYKLEFTGAGGKTILEWVAVPTQNPGSYKDRTGKQSPMPLKRLMKLLAALGEAVTISTLEGTLDTLFGSKAELVGKNVAIEVAYKGNHTKRNNGVIQIVDRKGTQLVGTPEFADYEALNKYVEEKRLEMKRFVDVTDYALSSVPNVKKEAAWG